MKGADQAGPSVMRGANFGAIYAAIAIFAALVVSPAAAQINGVPPSVTSIPLSHFSPNPRPSVTSLGPFGFHNGPGQPINTLNPRQFPFTRPFGSHGRGNGFWTYSIPYYLPYDSSGYGYGYDYVGGPDQYSGPPMTQSDPTLHIVVEQPPALPPSAYRGPAPQETPYARAVPPQQADSPEREAKPIETTVLIFRDGHKQEVGNYAIMGQVVYVFDDHAKKIALADLDLPATVKANDDRGLEFQIPPAKKKDSSLPRQSAPVQDTPKPSSIAAVILP